jgi:YYY domain-containing protein
LSEAVRFFLIALLLSAVSLPLVFHLFPRFPDRGYGLGRALALALAGYAYWIGRVVGVVPAGRGGTVLVLLLAVFVAGWVFLRHRREIVRWLRYAWPVLLLTEGIFATAFFGFAALRSYNPEIEATEKPMDYALLNAAVVSEDYPPQDPWLAGHDISYYYFGYVQMGFLTQVAGVAPEYGYNLGLTWTFAAAAAAAMSLGMALATSSRRLRRRFPASIRGVAAACGALTAAFLLLLGNLEGVFELLHAHGWADGLVSYADIENLEAQPQSSTWYPDSFWWWFRASRVIPDTINEFPYFSFILGDLHPHVMAIPLVMVATALAFAAWQSRRGLDWRELRRGPWRALALVVLLGGLAFENTWDLPTFGLLFLVAVLMRNVVLGGQGSTAQRARSAFLATGSYGLPLLALGALAYVPFYTEFSSQASGLQPHVTAGTRPFHFLIVFGPLLAAALFTPLAARRARADAIFAALALAAVVLVVWLFLAEARGPGGLSEALDSRGSGWGTLVALVALFTIFGAAALSSGLRQSTPTGFACLAGAFALLLLLGAELFYIDDVFDSRFNTVFKLFYQSWILLAPVAAYGLFEAVAAVRVRPVLRYAAPVLGAVAGLLLLGGAVYTITAIPGRTEGFAAEVTTLDGLEQHRRFRPDDVTAIDWLRENAPPGAIILEASGRTYALTDGQPVITDQRIDYTDAGRFSAFTGLQTLLGWPGHELQWRGSGDLFAGRLEEIDLLYLSESPADAVRILRKYGARYVVVGTRERQDYPRGLDKFQQFMNLVFESGDVRIYEIRATSPSTTNLQPAPVGG